MDLLCSADPAPGAKFLPFRADPARFLKQTSAEIGCFYNQNERKPAAFGAKRAIFLTNISSVAQIQLRGMSYHNTM